MLLNLFYKTHSINLTNIKNNNITNTKNVKNTAITEDSIFYIQNNILYKYSFDSKITDCKICATAVFYMNDRLIVINEDIVTILTKQLLHIKDIFLKSIPFKIKQDEFGLTFIFNDLLNNDLSNKDLLNTHYENGLTNHKNNDLTNNNLTNHNYNNFISILPSDQLSITDLFIPFKIIDIANSKSDSFILTSHKNISSIYKINNIFTKFISKPSKIFESLSIESISVFENKMFVFKKDKFTKYRILNFGQNCRMKFENENFGNFLIKEYSMNIRNGEFMNGFISGEIKCDNDKSDNNKCGDKSDNKSVKSDNNTYNNTHINAHINNTHNIYNFALINPTSAPFTILNEKIYNCLKVSKKNIYLSENRIYFINYEVNDNLKNFNDKNFIDKNFNDKNFTDKNFNDKNFNDKNFIDKNLLNENTNFNLQNLFRNIQIMESKKDFLKTLFLQNKEKYLEISKIKAFIKSKVDLLENKKEEIQKRVDLLKSNIKNSNSNLDSLLKILSEKIDNLEMKSLGKYERKLKIQRAVLMSMISDF